MPPELITACPIIEQMMGWNRPRDFGLGQRLRRCRLGTFTALCTAVDENLTRDGCKRCSNPRYQYN